MPLIAYNYHIYHMWMQLGIILLYDCVLYLLRTDCFFSFNLTEYVAHIMHMDLYRYVNLYSA